MKTEQHIKEVLEIYLALYRAIIESNIESSILDSLKLKIDMLRWVLE